MDLIWYLSNFDPINLYRVTKFEILTVQEAVQAKTMMIYWVSLHIVQKRAIFLSYQTECKNESYLTSWHTKAFKISN